MVRILAVKFRYPSWLLVLHHCTIEPKACEWTAALPTVAGADRGGVGLLYYRLILCMSSLPNMFNCISTSDHCLVVGSVEPCTVDFKVSTDLLSCRFPFRTVCSACELPHLLVLCVTSLIQFAWLATSSGSVGGNYHHCFFATQCCTPVSTYYHQAVRDCQSVGALIVVCMQRTVALLHIGMWGECLLHHTACVIRLMLASSTIGVCRGAPMDVE